MSIRIIIDAEFQALIPALSPEELAQLEANIAAHGCRDPLTLWDGVLLDGHHRYAICTRLGLPFSVVSVDLPDREAAMDWIDANQLGRRNLTPDAFRLLLGRRYNRAKKAHGGQIPGSRMAQSEPSITTADRLAEQHGVSRETVKRAAKFAEEVERTPALRAAIAENRPVLQVKRELKEAHREQRRQENRAKVELVSEPTALVGVAQFSTIVIDPPWDFREEGDDDVFGRTRPAYAQMTDAEVAELPIAELSDEDCHLYLWITNRSLLTGKGWRLAEAWGFRPITVITWCKPSIGVGNYFRNNTEHLVFAVKGSQPLRRADVGTWFEAPRGRDGHSSKPDEAYALIESVSPGPYLEMFARRHRAGWTLWGADALATR